MTGVPLTIWGVIGATSMVPWESNLAPRATPELMTIAWVSGMLGDLLAPVVFGIVIVRYGPALGAAGVAGAVLTPIGLIMSALGMGIGALLALAAGVLLFSWRARERILSTPVAVAFATGSLSCVLVFLAFAAGDGQNVDLLLPMVVLGPSWILFGLGLRQPQTMPDEPSPTASLAGA